MLKALGDEERFMQMAAETVAFSEYLVTYAVYFYLRAAHDVCKAFGLTPKDRLGESVAYALRRMHEVGDA